VGRRLPPGPSAREAASPNGSGPHDRSRPAAAPHPGGRIWLTCHPGGERDPGHASTVASQTLPDAAAALAISRSKLYELFAAGPVRSVRIDGSRRVPVEALEAYVAVLLDQEAIADAAAS
jgi:excisionase family DNA binding protein